MYGDLASEVVHCPNCKEDVPKTLYCLNCGYPLYKIESEKTGAEPVVEEPEFPDVEDQDVDMSIEIEPVQPEIVIEETEPEIENDVEIEVELETEIEVDEPAEEEPQVEEPAPVTDEEVEEVVEEPILEEEITEEPEPEKPEEELPVEPEIEVDPEPEEVTEEEEEPEEVEQKPEEEVPVEPEVVEEPVPEAIVESQKVEIIEEKPNMMDEIKLEFAPDPLTKEVMENLGKNITLKIRLVKLLRDDQVKEETFKKLFDSYVEQGRIWVGRRDEIIRRFNADIDRMEDSLVTARKDFELLEIRKSIGDANEEEYKVKAPAFRWDIEYLDREIKNRKAGVIYVENLKKLVPDEEIEELENLAESNYSDLDGIENISTDTVAKMKEALAESLNILQS